MTALAAATAETDPLAAHAAEAGAMLRELAELGMDMARDLGRFARALAASAPEEEAPTPEQAKIAEGLMRAFGRVSRAVRQSLALQARLLADIVKLRAPAAAEAAKRAEARAEALEERRLQGRLRRAMAGEMARSAIEALEREPLETERLFDDLDERYRAMRPETYGVTRERADRDEADFADIEVDLMALDLCDALGIDPGADWWFTKWGMKEPSRIRARRPVPAQPPP